MNARYSHAFDALQRYVQMGGEEARADAEVQRWLETLRKRLPGGELAADQLRLLPKDLGEEER
jgi:hypothetical protein